MPSFEHEFPLDLVRRAPEMAVQLLELAWDASLPEFVRVRCEAGEATTTAPPAELLSDSVAVLEGTDPKTAKPVNKLAIITEPQNGEDPNKRFSWPAYVANVRHRLRCPVVLLVLTPTESLAKWAAEPIDLGGGLMVQQPLTLPLSTLEPVRDPGQARKTPELAILAAAIRGTTDPTALEALPHALQALDESKTSLYADYVLSALPAAAKRYLEDLMSTGTYQWRSDIGRESFAKGKAEGEANAILAVLDARDISLTNRQRDTIVTCTDLDQLNVWVRRAATVARASQLFEED